jgi:tRNA pseudouridine55 synthase
VLDGFLVVDKPSGMTSHDVVAILRRIFQQKKIGHTGTLDPFATGVLPIALGEGTKAIPFLDESFKEYQAVMRLGISTDTLDFTGEVIAEREWGQITPEMVSATIPGFIGSILQTPPMFSALKRNGVPLYKLARNGETVEREPRRIEIQSLQIDRIDLPYVAFTVRCSRGTYVRTLADDIGEALGTGAHLTKLRRVASGAFTLALTKSLEEIASSVGNIAETCLIKPRDALSHLPELSIGETAYNRLRNGIALSLSDIEGNHGMLPESGLVKIIYRDDLAAVCNFELSEAGTLRIERVFNQFYSLQHPV